MSKMKVIDNPDQSVTSPSQSRNSDRGGTHATGPTVVDGVLYEWGDRIKWNKLRGKGGPKTVFGFGFGGSGKKSGSSSGDGRGGGGASGGGLSPRDKLSGIARKTPEVVVKVSGGGKGMSQIRNHMDYISRNGDVLLEDENGNVISGKEAVQENAGAWQRAGFVIPSESRQKEAHNIVFSMPPGTDREAVTEAVRKLAHEEFDNHQYVFARHDDEDHVHVHLCIKAVGKDMQRLHPKKADLQRWREKFAVKLRERGIEANATSRSARGVTRKAEKQAVRHAGKRGRSHVKDGQGKAIQEEISGGKRRVNPAQEKIVKRRQEEIAAYSKVAIALAQSADPADRTLAVAVARHAQALPPIKTRHEQVVERAREKMKEREGVTLATQKMPPKNHDFER